MRVRWISGLVVSLGLLQGIPDAAGQLRTRSPSTSTSTTASTTTEGASTTFAESTSPPARSSTLRVTPGLCLTPTLAQCTNATWLDSACGREEIASGTTCDDLIDAAMQDRASDASPGWVPWSMHPEGVAQVVDGGSLSAGEHYSPDPFVIGSGYVSAEYGMPVPRGFVAPGTLQIEDVYDGWATTSTFQSCEEYVYERYYEIHELLRAVGAESSNALRVVQIAFGPEDDRASFGTRHLTSLVVRDVAGAPRHTLAYDSHSPGTFNAMSPKNAFFWLPPHQSTEIPDPGPDLHASIRAYSSAGAAYLDLVASARAEDAPGSANYAQNIYPRTLAYDRWWYTQALFERPRGPAVDHSGSPTDFLPGIGASDGPPAAADDLMVFDDGTPPTAEELLGSVTSVPGMRRYLANELDELYRVQTQLEELAARWYALNWRFEGSGWRPSALAPTPRTNVGGLTTRSRGGHNTIDNYDSVHSSPPDTAAGGGTFALDGQGGADTNVGGFAAVDGSETALRRAIVAEIVALLERGADAGCLEPGITPCDWSPAKLADRILRSPDREREREFRRCQSLVDGVAEGSSHPPSLGLMMNLLGETLVFEMPDGSPSCQVTVPTASRRATWARFTTRRRRVVTRRRPRRSGSICSRSKTRRTSGTPPPAPCAIRASARRAKNRWATTSSG